MTYNLMLLSRKEDLRVYRDWLTKHLKANMVDKESLLSIITASEEAVFNSITHAYEPGVEGPISVELTLEDSRVQLKIEDNGGSDVKKIVKTPGDPYSGSGRGFLYMETLMDSVDVSSQNGKTVVTLMKNVNPSHL